MIDETGFIEAVAKSGVLKVAMIDDVFDVPQANQTNSGVLLDWIDGNTAEAAFTKAGLETHHRLAAKEAIERSEFESEVLISVLSALYHTYIETLEPALDPGLFKVREPNLRRLRPLLLLLKKCSSIQLDCAGSEELEAYKETHLLFVDFYLDEGLGPDDIPSGANADSARSAALRRVEALIESQGGQTPSIVLMSSKDVSKEAAQFRRDIKKGRVFASRFTFLHKDKVSADGNGTIAITPDAADALLDVIQSYRFGRALQNGLDNWLSSATDAVNKLREEIHQMDLKDFAYLVRFRLAQEGQGLLDYLEWFFGECLVDALGKAVDERAKSKPEITALNDDRAGEIEGAYEGPTTKVAELFHRVRIEAPRVSRRKHFRLGDVYQVGKHKVVSTITPDCDLIARENGQRKAKQLLTVAGSLKPLNTPDRSVSDFFMLDNVPNNIVWNSKELATHEFDKWPAPGDSTAEVKFLGTLRPMYGQQLQHDVLHDLGRVGVAVAPAIPMTAAVVAKYKEKSGTVRTLDLSAAGSTPSVVVMRRNEADKPKILFERRLVRAMLDAIKKIDPSLVAEPTFLHQLGTPDAYVKLSKMYREGVGLEDAIGYGIFLSAKLKPSGEHWCWLTVSLADQGET